MKTVVIVYLAECENCKTQYGFVTGAERDEYITTWHPGHKVNRTSKALE